MSAHAYFYAGEQEAGIAVATKHATDVLGLSRENNPDLIIFRYGLFSVDDARRVIRIANQSAVGSEKLIVIAAERIFHEAQNALLKLFEEPPLGTTLVLVVPSRGMLLSTLRSRMLPLGETALTVDAGTKSFIAANTAEREKIISKLLERAKSDKDEEKQAARGEALRLAEGLLQVSYEIWKKEEDEVVLSFAHDLERFVPIFHERSAPLKLIFEHILLTMPRNLVV